MSLTHPGEAGDGGETGERVNFSKIRTTIPLPNLIAVQRASYEQFLQMDLLPEERVTKGLQAVFTSVFPFSDFRSSCELHFVFCLVESLRKDTVQDRQRQERATHFEQAKPLGVAHLRFASASSRAHRFRLSGTRNVMATGNTRGSGFS